MNEELRLMMKERRSVVSEPHTLARAKSTSETTTKMRDNPDTLPFKPQSIVDIVPSEGSFFHAMISYRVATDATFVNHLHNSINLVASQRDDLRVLDDFPWPKGFKRAETTGSSGVRVFLDKFCLLDGAQWEGNMKGGGFVGALLQSLVFVPVFSANAGFSGSLGQIARIWNPFWDVLRQLRRRGPEG